MGKENKIRSLSRCSPLFRLNDHSKAPWILHAEILSPFSYSHVFLLEFSLIVLLCDIFVGNYFFIACTKLPLFCLWRSQCLFYVKILNSIWCNKLNGIRVARNVQVFVNARGGIIAVVYIFDKNYIFTRSFEYAIFKIQQPNLQRNIIGDL